jgi:hypothetical protein
MEKGAGGRLLEAAAAAAALLLKWMSQRNLMIQFSPTGPARRETFPVASSSYLAFIQFQHDNHAVLICKLHIPAGLFHKF